MAQYFCYCLLPLRNVGRNKIPQVLLNGRGIQQYYTQQSNIELNDIQESSMWTVAVELQISHFTLFCFMSFGASKQKKL